MPYCQPTWYNICYTNISDIELNFSIKSIPENFLLKWLPYVFFLLILLLYLQSNPVPVTFPDYMVALSKLPVNLRVCLLQVLHVLHIRVQGFCLNGVACCSQERQHRLAHFQMQLPISSPIRLDERKQYLHHLKIQQPQLGRALVSHITFALNKLLSYFFAYVWVLQSLQWEGSCHEIIIQFPCSSKYIRCWLCLASFICWSCARIIMRFRWIRLIGLMICKSVNMIVINIRFEYRI